MIAELDSFEASNTSANKIAFDPSGTVLGIGLNNGIVKFWGLQDKKRNNEVDTTDNSCQALVFDRSGEYLVTSGNSKIM
jgi:sperm-associated antigen 16 protein